MSSVNTSQIVAKVRAPKKSLGSLMKELFNLVSYVQQHGRPYGFISASATVKHISGVSRPYYEFSLLLNGDFMVCGVYILEGKTKELTHHVYATGDVRLGLLIINTLINRLKELSWEFSRRLPETYDIYHLIGGKDGNR